MPLCPAAVDFAVLSEVAFAGGFSNHVSMIRVGAIVERSLPPSA